MVQDLEGKKLPTPAEIEPDLHSRQLKVRPRGHRPGIAASRSAMGRLEAEGNCLTARLTRNVSRIAQPVVLVLGMVVRRVHHEKHTHHDKHDECGLRVQELASAAMPAPLSHWPLGVSPALRYPGDSRQHAYIFRDRHFNAQRRQQKLSSKREAKSLELQKKLDGCVGSSKWCLRGLGLWPPRAACDSARREPPPSLAQLVQGV